MFQRLKEAFTMEPVLAILDLDKKIRVESNASDYATGGVLSVKCKDKRWRPIAFISKLLNITEQNYKIHNKEILTVIQCLEV